MKGLRFITHLLVIIGAVNWGLIGFFGYNLVSSLFGADTTLTRVIYILVGLSGLYAIGCLCRCCGGGCGCGCGGSCNCRKR